MAEGDGLLAALSADDRAVLAQCGELAAARGERAFLVGGSVRDLLLGRAPDDLDVVVEGDGLAVAQAVARAAGGRLTRHHAFQTARVDLEAGRRLDIATARREDYPGPGKLPQVVAGSLDDDLVRRDFTINTLAICLGPEGFGALHDPLHGAADLKTGHVRVMHARSFADDPTRILRALRFALRFDYRIEERTAVWMTDAVRGGYLDLVSGDRLRRELALTFEEAPVAGPLRLQEENVLTALHPGLRASRETLDELQRLVAWYRGVEERHAEVADAGAATRQGREVPAPDTWPLVLALCASELVGQERWALVKRLALSRAEREPLVDGGARFAKAHRRLAAAGADAPPDSVIERAWRGFSSSTLVVAAAAIDDTESVRNTLLRYLETIRWIKPLLGGDDLRSMDVAEGPEIGAILDELLAARLDGEVSSAIDERRLVARRLGEKPRG